MDYQASVKIIPACIVYYSETVLPRYADAMQWIPAQGAEAKALNPDGIPVQTKPAASKRSKRFEAARYCRLPTRTLR